MSRRWINAVSATAFVVVGSLFAIGAELETVLGRQKSRRYVDAVAGQNSSACSGARQ